MIPRTLALVCFTLMVGPLSLADEKKEDKKTAEKKAQVAHIRLAGDMDETPTAADPLLGLSAENFKSKLDRIKKAQADPTVHAMLLHVDGVNLSWAKVEELRGAIAEFRKSGKKTYAYLEAGNSTDYLVGSECDVICLPASGWLMITGLRAEVTFFKELLEKLGIRADFIQMGVYKSAAETFTRTRMSPEAKAQLKLVLDDFFDNSLVGAISRSRSRGGRPNLTSDQISKLIDGGPFTSRRAAEVGLVDHVAYAAELEELIQRDLQMPIKVVKNYGQQKAQDLDFSNPFSLFKLFAPPKTAFRAGKDRIALIYAVGTIMTGKSSESLLGGGTVGSTTMVEAIRKAEQDPKVKAIVLRVDSPGGSALASDLIWQELKRCKKPVVASMSDVAASGGYYISMAARKIYAQPGTLTGSIGVFGGKLALGGLYSKIGITTETISRGANAGIFSTTDGFSPSQRQAVEKLMVEVYDQFLTKAIEGRTRAGKSFTRDSMLKVAEGRIWTGRQALANGLVDALGSLEDAIGEAKVLAGLPRDADTDFLVLPKARTFIDALLEKSSDASSGVLLRALANLPELRPHARTLEGLLQLRAEPVWLMVPHGLQVRP